MLTAALVSTLGLMDCRIKTEAALRLSHGILVSTLGLMDCRIKTNPLRRGITPMHYVSTLGLMDCRIKTSRGSALTDAFSGFNPWFDGL